jgi:hypothetical protein
MSMINQDLHHKKIEILSRLIKDNIISKAEALVLLENDENTETQKQETTPLKFVTIDAGYPDWIQTYPLFVGDTYIKTNDYTFQLPTSSGTSF